MRWRLTFPSLLLSFSLTLSGCGSSSPRFTSHEKPEVVAKEPLTHQLQGVASYYADEFQGRATACGEIYDMNELTAAHRTLPFNTRLRVINLENQKSVIVRVNDRGPFKDERVIDLSLEAARQLGMIAHGTAEVSLEIVEMGGPGK